MEVLLFQTHVQDKKHGLEFDKDRISYRHKTFDCVLSHEFRENLTKVMLTQNLKYPILLVIGDDDYFVKAKKFTKADGTKGTKQRVTILNAQSIAQGKFENKSLDSICDEIDESIQAGMEAYGELDDVDED